MGIEGGAAKAEGEGNPTFERFKVVAEVLTVTSLWAAIGVSLWASYGVSAAAREANAAAADANAAVREGNEAAAVLEALDANASLAAVLPRVIIAEGNNYLTGDDGYGSATGYNTSQYPAIVVGAKLNFQYFNVEGDNETSNLALESATTDSCVFEVWSSDDGAASSAVSPCTEPVSVGPDDILWVSAEIPDEQKRMFCARHPEGVAGFSIEVQHALYNVSNDINDTPDPRAINLQCEGRSFEDSP